jgi:hypothetical protein
MLPGDGGDTQFIIRMLEHWVQVARGAAEWRSPQFFYPVEGVAGYSELMILYALPFGFARALGLDMYSSYQVVLALFTGLGFAGMALLLRRTLRLPVIPSVLGAFLFATLHSMTNASYHGQLFALFLLPWAVIPVVAYCRLPDPNSRRGWTLGITSVVALALVFETSFYMGWFLAFFSLLGLLVILIYGLSRLGWRRTIDRCISLTQPRRRQLIVLILSFLLVMVPFLLVYMPVALSIRAGRPYNPKFLISPADLFNLGSNNLIWGSWLPTLDGIFGRQSQEIELIVGIAPVMLLVFLVVLLANVMILARRATSQPSGPEDRVPQLVVVLGACVVLSFLSIVKVGEYSPWWLVRKLVPGASAMAAPSRYMLALAIPIVIVSMIGLVQLWRGLMPRFTGARRALAVSFVVALGAILELEQISTSSPLLLSKQEKLALHSKFSSRPPGCEVAYVVPSTEGGRAWYEYQNDAMMISANAGMKTINGYSGNFPEHWKLWDPELGEYHHEVHVWLLEHDLHRRACGLDLAAQTWFTKTQEEMQKAFTYQPGDLINFRRDFNTSRTYQLSGWYHPEGNGTWTRGKKASLAINPQGFDLGRSILLEPRFNPLLLPDPKTAAAIAVNGKVVWRGSVRSTLDLTITIPEKVVKSGDFITIDFLIEKPKVLKELGINEDTRELGLFVHELRLSQAP